MALLWQRAIKDLYHLVISSPKLFEYFDFVPSTKGAFATIKPNRSMKDQWPPIIHVLVDLRREDTSTFMGTMSMLEEMQRVVESDPYHCASIHVQMMEEIAKLAALAQIIDAQYRHQPDVHPNQDSDIVIADYRARLQTIDDLEVDLGEFLMNKHLLPISDFKYPAWKKQTSQNVEQMRWAEAKLDMFWQHLNEKLLGKYGKTLMDYMDNKVAHRDIARTPPWQPSKEQQQQPRETPKPSLSEPYTFTQHHVPEISGNAFTEPREKQKTRGTADPIRASSSTIPATTTQDQDPPAQVFRLHHRALKTIKAFYPTTTEDREGRKPCGKTSFTPCTA